MSAEEDWQRGWNGIAADLAQLLAAGSMSQPLSAPDLDAAAAAHGALVAFLAQTLRDVTGSYDPEADLQIANVRSVAVLSWSLRNHPHVAGAALSDTMQAPLTPAGQPWAALGRDVALAEHAWTGSPRSALPRGDAAWSVVADVAAVASVLMVLDRDLATQLERHGRSDEAQQLRQATAGASLQFAAAEVQVVARGRAQPGQQQWSPTSLPVTPVTAAGQIGAAQTRLAAQLRSTSALPPQDLRIVALQQLRLALAAAESAAEPRLAAELVQLARSLDAVTSPRLRVRSVEPPGQSDSAPARQAQALHWFLTATDDLGPALATTVATTAPLVLAAMTDAANRNVAQGRWLVPNPDSDQPTAPLWMPAKGSEIPFVTHLQRAHEQAVVTASAAVAAVDGQHREPAAAPARAAQASLAAALSARLALTDDPAARGRRSPAENATPGPPPPAPPKVPAPPRGPGRGR